MDQRDRLIVVTGANGFIGRHLSAALAGDGFRVRGMTRSPSGVAVGDVESAVARDILDRDAVRSALAGASAVVHLAARVHAKTEGSGDPAAECQRVNVDGTRVLIEEAAAAGVKQFVFISSVKAVANESDEALTADTPPQPVDPYGESKLEGERLVKVVAAREGIDATILRLPNVYGPGMKANMGALFRAVDAGLPLPLGAVRNRRSFAYIDNAVEAMRRILLSAPSTSTETFYVSDGEDVSTPQLVRHIAAALQRPARLVPVPPAVLRSMAGIGGLLSRFQPFHLTGDSLTAVLGSLFVDITRLREKTGFAPLTSVEMGMLRTAEWYRSRSQAMS